MLSVFLRRLVLAVILTAAFTMAPGIAKGQGGIDNDIARPQVCQAETVNLPPALLRHLERLEPARGSAGPATEEMAILIEADTIRSDEPGIFFMNGNVHVIQGRRGIFADRAEFSEFSRVARFFGNVVLYTEYGDEMKTDTMEIEIDTFLGTMTDEISIRFVQRPPPVSGSGHFAPEFDHSALSGTGDGVFSDARDNDAAGDLRVSSKATAEIVEINGRNYQVMRNATLTACTGENRDVVLSARQLELDHERGVGTADHLVVRFKNVPIFYVPKATFPITGARMTGFLFPRFGHQKNSGLILSLPYYLNLDPQYDATITPSIFEKRGLQVFGELRYLTPRSQGSIKGEILPDDRVFRDDRYALSYRHRQALLDGMKLDVDIQKVSDTHYLSDFSGNIDSRASIFVPQRVSLDINSRHVLLNATASAYERASDHVGVDDQPYDRLPKLNLEVRRLGLSPFEFGARAELVRYRHDVKTRISGTRLRLIPSLSMPLERAYGYVYPKVTVHSIRYNLSNTPDGERTPSETIPIWSIDSGLFFERTVRLDGRRFLQTLEPRLFYLDIPVRYGQAGFPDFNTGDGNANSFSHFFRENRFFGGDRVGDTRQVTVGVSSRLIDGESGQERLKASAGQVFYLEDSVIGVDPVVNPDTPEQKADTSDFLLGLSGSLTRHWTLDGFARWSREQDEFSYLSLLSRLEHGEKIKSEVGYIRDGDQREYLNVNHDSAIGPRWRFRSRFNYSVEEDQFQFVEIGGVYLNCCWALGINLQRYQSDGERHNRFMMTFQLKGLGGIYTRQ
ncbi:MAG: LPS assembly protein LptD [Gammaproteobacteria bacterium]|nr:LPS assembly protein LptD [Gammaproteobacteria bacterium]